MVNAYKHILMKGPIAYPLLPPHVFLLSGGVYITGSSPVILDQAQVQEETFLNGLSTREVKVADTEPKLD